MSVHSDSGRQPLNWFGPPNVLTEDDSRWLIINSKNERLAIELHKVVSDTTVELGGYQAVPSSRWSSLRQRGASS